MKLRLLLPLALFTLLCACSGDDERKDRTPTPAESPSALGNPVTPGASTTAQALGLRTQAVKWVDAEAYDPKNITESTEPVWTRDRRLAALPDEARAWSAYVVRPDSPPLPLYNTTNRWLRNLTWDKDGLAMQFATRRVVSLTGSGDKATLDWQGKLTIDPAAAVVREEFDAMPASGGNDSPGRQPDDRDRTVSVQRDQANSQAVLSIGTGNGPFRQIDTVYLVDKQGRAKRLEGIKDLRQLDFMPGGGALHAFAAQTTTVPFHPANESYIIPTSDGQAIYVGETPFRAEGMYGTGSTKSSRLLILVPDPAATTPGASLMVLYDTNKHDLRVLAKGPPVLLPSPSGFPTQVPITWPEASDEFAIGSGQDAVIVNAVTGAMRPGQPQELLQTSPPDSRSPSGRYRAAIFATLPLPQGVECAGKPAGVTVTDTQTGETKTFLECATGTGGPLTWLDDHTLAVMAFNCNGCQSKTAGLTLLDVASGRATPLIQGLELGASVTPSPDGHRFVVADKGLRVYDYGGALIRDLGPAPEGLRHTSLAWAPDNRSFAYILGPM